MKDLLKRTILGFILFLLTMTIFYIVVSCIQKEKIYHYMTEEGEWGISNNCYIGKNGYGCCYKGYELIPVKQFYEV